MLGWFQILSSGILVQQCDYKSIRWWITRIHWDEVNLVKFSNVKLKKSQKIPKNIIKEAWAPISDQKIVISTSLLSPILLLSFLLESACSEGLKTILKLVGTSKWGPSDKYMLGITSVYHGKNCFWKPSFQNTNSIPCRLGVNLFF